MSPIEAGLTMTPMSLAIMVAAPLAGRLTDRIGARWILVTGLTLMVSGILLIVSRIDLETDWRRLLPALLITGAGMGMTFAPMTAAAMAAVPPRIAGSASGIVNTMRNVGQVLGIAVLGALAGVDPDAATAQRKSRRRAKRSRQTRPEPDGRCEFSSPGDPCQDAACIDETTLRPACSCDEQGQCICPDAAACPNHLLCVREKGVCLTECRDDFDCAKGTICEADGRCTVQTSGPSCDCANLDYCNGNGSCTLECTCVCYEGWTGATCGETPNDAKCSDHLTCLACNSDIADGCVFCSSTIGGANDVCVTADECLIPQDGCK
jgi:hypothetical protein